MTTQNEITLPDDEPVIIINRVFDAPRELVWEVMTDPKHVMQYWGPHGFTTTSCDIDLRPGGLWRYVMRAPDGAEYPVTHVYHEIVPPERIVYSNHEEGRQAASSAPPNGINTITLEDLGGGKTKVTAHTRLQSDADRETLVQMGHVQGVGEGLDRMAEYLKTLA